MGKNQSKLKEKHRTRSVAWSSNLTSQEEMSFKKTEESGAHLDISQWLKVLDLEQYESNFNGFTGVEDLLCLSEAEVKKLGVKNSAHRARIVSSLVVLKKKYERCKVPDGTSAVDLEGRTQRQSLVEDGRKWIDRGEKNADSVLHVTAAQSKSLSNIKMESGPDSEFDRNQLRKALEWELSLDARDLRSHAWYHGSIPRSRAEEILDSDGDFLVRDCISQPGNYVLSTKWKGQCLHFVINKVVLQRDTVYERIQYQFEDEAYDTVSDLITYYVGSGKVISALSGAKIQTPKNRFHPLSFYAMKYAVPNLSTIGSSASINSRYSSVNATGISSPLRQKHDVPPKLPGKQKSIAPSLSEDNVSKTQLSQGNGEKTTSADGIIKDSAACFPISSLVSGSEKKIPVTTEGSILNEACEPGIPPPKPSRIPSFSPETEGELGHISRHFSKSAGYKTFGSDSGNGSSDSAESSAAGDSNEAATPCGTMSGFRGVVIKNPRYGGDDSSLATSASSTTLKANECDSSAEEFLASYIPKVKTSSAFDLENFQTLLLPTLENKPVDQSALECVKGMLRENGSRILANHLTRMDLELTINQKPESYGSCELDLGILSGIELCALPQGQQLRQDIIERAECLKLMVAVTILTCASDTERAETLHKWIQVAIDIKTALGNLFGFSAIMLGLCLPQIQRLTETWHILRQKFTDSAFNFEAKLRPTLKNMNECTNPQAPNTTIPYVLPFVWLQDLVLEDILGIGDKSETSSVADCLRAFESTPDSGLGMLHAHLESGRKFAEMVPFYRRNAKIILGDSKIDDLILDMFRTEFHLKFLWGSRGASVCCRERRDKFNQVLSVMSEKCEPSVEEAGA